MAPARADWAMLQTRADTLCLGRVHSATIDVVAHVNAMGTNDPWKANVASDVARGMVVRLIVRMSRERHPHTCAASGRQMNVWYNAEHTAWAATEQPYTRTQVILVKFVTLGTANSTVCTAPNSAMAPPANMVYTLTVSVCALRQGNMDARHCQRVRQLRRYPSFT